MRIYRSTERKGKENVRTRVACMVMLLGLVASWGCGSEGGEGPVTFGPGFDLGHDEPSDPPAQADLLAPPEDVRRDQREEPDLGPIDPGPDATPADVVPEVVCAPACEGRECGDDGCGGLCGTCPEAAPLCIEYKCKVQCIPDCTGKECGDDGCGNPCGQCPEGAPECVDFKCVLPCTPDCAGKECGDDGCGGLCGTCPAVAPICDESFKCALDCLPDCGGKVCGSDGCGGSCGECPEAAPLCVDGLCKPDPGTIEDGCTEEGKQIFLVTESKWLLRFEPLTQNIVPIGQLNCNAAWGETPYSMSVDRNSFAWVLYSDGTLWKVDTETAACQPTAFQPDQLGFEIFGMGFSTDSPNTKEETLFIAGGDLWDMMYGDATLGSIDPETLTVTSIAPFAVGSGLPELTGNRSAELWGFFPKTSPPRIAAINKENAGLLQAFLLPANLFADVQAWAFAHWGGDFYIFFKSNSAMSSGIWRVNTGTGDVETEVASTGYVITGAGVSTCAPTE